MTPDDLPKKMLTHQGDPVPMDSHHKWYLPVQELDINMLVDVIDQKITMAIFDQWPQTASHLFVYIQLLAGEFLAPNWMGLGIQYKLLECWQPGNEWEVHPFYSNQGLLW